MPQLKDKGLLHINQALLHKDGLPEWNDRRMEVVAAGCKPDQDVLPLLAGHNDRILPIGVVGDIRVSEGEVRADIMVNDAHYIQGILEHQVSISIGYRIGNVSEIETIGQDPVRLITEWELLEISVVPKDRVPDEYILTPKPEPPRKDLHKRRAMIWPRRKSGSE